MECRYCACKHFVRVSPSKIQRFSGTIVEITEMMCRHCGKVVRRRVVLSRDEEVAEEGRKKKEEVADRDNVSKIS